MSRILCPWCAWPFGIEAEEHREGCPASPQHALLDAKAAEASEQAESLEQEHAA